MIHSACRFPARAGSRVPDACHFWSGNYFSNIAASAKATRSPVTPATAIAPQVPSFGCNQTYIKQARMPAQGPNILIVPIAIMAAPMLSTQVFFFFGQKNSFGWPPVEVLDSLLLMVLSLVSSCALVLASPALAPVGLSLHSAKRACSHRPDHRAEVDLFLVCNKIYAICNKLQAQSIL